MGSSAGMDRRRDAAISLENGEVQAGHRTTVAPPWRDRQTAAPRSKVMRAEASWLAFSLVTSWFVSKKKSLNRGVGYN